MGFMHRFALDHLQEWKNKRKRKPLIIRGARQVGKSWLTRLFAAKEFSSLVEVNFERDPDAATLFESNSPQKIIGLLELHRNRRIEPGKTLLFLDEIQAAPKVLSSLRYFYEELPELHILAAGSLLEFVLAEHDFSMPVGRVEYLHLGPMFYEEFLIASGENRLRDFLASFELGDEIPEAIHKRLMDHLHIFLATGGMPESVESWVVDHSLQVCEEVKQSILSTYFDDFAKYGKRVNVEQVRKVFKKLPSLAGSRFKYVNVDPGERAKDIARDLGLLCLARVAYPVRHSSCSGVPLGAQVDERKFKVLFLDVGLLSSGCGLTLLDMERAEDVMLVNRGSVCEQFVGQHLLYSLPPYREPELYFWTREKKNSAAELDYVISEGTSLVPIEVKAGKAGTLKSLHLFIKEKQRPVGIRLNSAPPSILNTETHLPGGESIPFKLVSLPLYLVGQLRRLAKTVADP